eukprot:CAMPEP_0181170434 /NCGR_PEP_ID=MMETSP1096-20121128/1363_1 /TAXON_ID=156174 ORGANISM="Chrysochromulina ericina, Strain CCMP281" /NCGR_SAMPLE_ID=MMETSP1096 /ASSEMBLY_ACC=CAM_ASM_000453 /LENGTH=68 /DNA_ID=CAMNT_0023257993 /DNA_START=1122 /DNA_END=1324 /DNA_ORIENTATION=+
MSPPASLRIRVIAISVTELPPSPCTSPLVSPCVDAFSQAAFAFSVSALFPFASAFALAAAFASAFASA